MATMETIEVLENLSNAVDDFVKALDDFNERHDNGSELILEEARANLDEKREAAKEVLNG